MLRLGRLRRVDRAHRGDGLKKVDLVRPDAVLVDLRLAARGWPRVPAAAAGERRCTPDAVATGTATTLTRPRLELTYASTRRSSTNALDRRACVASRKRFETTHERQAQIHDTGVRTTRSTFFKPISAVSASTRRSLPAAAFVASVTTTPRLVVDDQNGGTPCHAAPAISMHPRPGRNCQDFARDPGWSAGLREEVKPRGKPFTARVGRLSGKESSVMACASATGIACSNGRSRRVKTFAWSATSASRLN